MKKLFILIVFVAVAARSFAQDSFNPYQLYSENLTTVALSSGHRHFMKALATHNETMTVHHGVAFRYDRFDRSINMRVMMNTLVKRYSNKGFSIEDGLSLIHSFMNNGIKSGQTLNHKGNFFIINDNGHKYAILVGWSNIQDKWCMIALDTTDREPHVESLFALRNASVICKTN